MRSARILLALAVGSALACGDRNPDKNPEGAAAPEWFREESAARGLDFEHRSGADGRFLMPEIMTTAAALFDADGDGDLDAYLGQADGVDTPPEERRGNAFFENLGDGRFREVTDAGDAHDRGYAMAVATGDYDGDGDVDIFVSNLGRNTLLRNDGGLRFTDVTEEAGLAGTSEWSASAAFVDIDGDGDLDIFVTNYIVWAVDAELDCRSPRNTRTYCSPKSYGAPAQDRLYENLGDGTFRDVTEAVGLSAAFGNGLGVLCADFDLDGAPEIFVANDGTPNQYWDRNASGRYVDRSTELGCAVDIQGRAKAGMGVAAADVDRDGDEDLLVVNLTGEDDSFYRNDAGSFVDRTPAVGLTVVSRRRTRFGVALRDFDLDGHVDVFQANGRVTEPGELREGDPFAEENVLLRGRSDGRFEEVLPRGGLRTPLMATSRAAAFGDIDGDGDIDVLVHNRDGRAHLLVNVAPRSGDVVVLDVRDRRGAPAIGAVVLIESDGRTTRYEVRTADSYGAASTPLLHVPVAKGGALERIRVTWPTGESRALEGVAAGARERITPPDR